MSDEHLLGELGQPTLRIYVRPLNEPPSRAAQLRKEIGAITDPDGLADFIEAHKDEVPVDDPVHLEFLSTVRLFKHSPSGVDVVARLCRGISETPIENPIVLTVPTGSDYALRPGPAGSWAVSVPKGFFCRIEMPKDDPV